MKFDFTNQDDYNNVRGHAAVIHIWSLGGQ
jgi:hypothetical protein